MCKANALPSLTPRYITFKFLLLFLVTFICAQRSLLADLEDCMGYLELNLSQPSASKHTACFAISLDLIFNIIKGRHKLSVIRERNPDEHQFRGINVVFPTLKICLQLNLRYIPFPL